MRLVAASRVALAAASAVFLASAWQSLAADNHAPAEPAAQGSTFKNLQVLPKDIEQAQLMNVMKSFALSLGVRCTHCHVGEEGQPLSTFDFPSDDKENKRIAREMMKMTMMINRHHFDAPEPRDFKVTCYTCHRGSTEPATRVPSPPAG